MTEAKIGKKDMIRNARREDVGACLEMLQRFHETAALEDKAPYDPASLSATLHHLIDSDSGILLVSDCLRAIAGGLIYPSYWNTSVLHGQELFWWVNPAARGIGADLFKALETEAKAKGAATWAMITLENLRPDATGRFYERHGYSPTEHTYMKRL